MKARTLATLSIAVVGIMLLNPAGLAGADSKGQEFLIMLQAGTESHEGLARALHALLYTKELKEGGHDVTLMFDGAGTAWARECEKADHKLHAAYTTLKALGVTQVICDFCSGAFQVKEGLSGEQKGLLDGSYNSHPSILKWVSQGYEIILL